MFPLSLPCLAQPNGGGGPANAGSEGDNSRFAMQSGLIFCIAKNQNPLSPFAM